MCCKMVPEKKHKKSKSKEKEKKKHHGRKGSSVSEDELFNDEPETDDDAAINLNEELHPIGYYVNDRKTMLDHVFSVTTERKIRAMLPPILKPLPLLELKSLCLDQLLGMSTKRVISILDGQQLESSSGTDDDNDGSDVETKVHAAGETNNCEELGDIDGYVMSEPEDTLEIGITTQEMGDLFTDDGDSKMAKKKEKAKHTSKKKHKKRSDKEKEKKKEDSSSDSSTKAVQKETVEEEKGKSLLEILELEMRARAIRALLREHGDSPVRAGERQGSVELVCEQETALPPSIHIKEEKPFEQKKIKRQVPELASHNKRCKSRKMESRGHRRTRQPKTCSEVPIKAEVIDVDSDNSVELKEIVKVIHSDLETVSSGEEVFVDMIDNSDPVAKEDGEISSVGGDDVIEVEYDAGRDVIVVDDSDGDVDEPARTLSDEVSELRKSPSPEGMEMAVSEERPAESWAQRWLKSKGVQKVVTDSKMFARIHKRMKTAHKGRVSPERATTVSSVEAVEVVGSVDEYQSLKLK
ncbi:DNA ligase 1 isoform X2 [Bacillus rossius redtenbacheri]|uniref:DNA ligase 1 isoform X2 n=1 Tax=Bacillus rossius redtenbacheri TaxID=93214 RepID=UPI002FDD2811